MTPSSWHTEDELLDLTPSDSIRRPRAAATFAAAISAVLVATVLAVLVAAPLSALSARARPVDEGRSESRSMSSAMSVLRIWQSSLLTYE